MEIACVTQWTCMTASTASHGQDTDGHDTEM